MTIIIKMQNNEYMSVKEAADFLGRSERYIKYLKNCGLEIIGGKITKEALLNCLKEHPNPCKDARKKQYK